MVTAIASTPKQRTSQNPKRPPLLPSDSGNAQPRRPKGREVTSRYLSLSTSSSSSNSSSSTNTTLSSITSGSSISSRRSPSPMLSTRTTITTPKSQQRAVSAERRRPEAATPSSAQRMLVTSMRSLSVSFQGESYSVPVSKVKPPPAMVGIPGGLRKGTPERRKAGVTPVRDRVEREREISRPSNQQQHRWPGRLRGENPSFLTRSLDYRGAERVKLSGSGSAVELRKSIIDESSRSTNVHELKLENKDVEVRRISELDSPSRLDDLLNSGVESVSSESTQSGNSVQLRGGPRMVVVPARCWPDASNRVHKVLDPASPLSSSPSCRTVGPSKLIAAKKFPNDSPVSSPREVSVNRGLSPLRGGLRPASSTSALRMASPSRASMASPSRASMASPSRANMASPSRARMASPSRSRSGFGNTMNDNNTCSTPSMLTFATDVRRGKLGENRIADAHDLRLLHNRLLQWRLANARVENTLSVQKQTAEISLYNAWMTTSKLQQLVRSKKIELQLLRHNLKLYSIIEGQVPHLENWGLFDKDYCNSVAGAIKALEASTIRLPIVGGAKADVREVQEAISSAVDMMQAMASSICSLLSKMEHVNVLVSELSSLSGQEHRLLDECKVLMSTTFIPLQVTSCSLRTHVLQVQQQVPATDKLSKESMIH